MWQATIDGTDQKHVQNKKKHFIALNAVLLLYQFNFIGIGILASNSSKKKKSLVTWHKEQPVTDASITSNDLGSQLKDNCSFNVFNLLFSHVDTWFYVEVFEKLI